MCTGMQERQKRDSRQNDKIMSAAADCEDIFVGVLNLEDEETSPTQSSSEIVDIVAGLYCLGRTR